MIVGMALPARGALVWRLYLLGSIQLVLLAGAVVGVGQVIRHQPREHPPAVEPGRPPGPHHPPAVPLAPLLTFFFSGLVIVGVGAFFTERWIVRPLLLAERELLANVSHELRTPLARLRVALDIAAEAESESGRQSTAEMAMDLAEVESIVEDILTATRLDIQRGRADRPGFALHLEAISPSELCRRAADRFRARHPTRPLDLALVDEPPMVQADPVLFRRVLDNLLENADKYSPDATRPVRLRTSADRRSVVFEIADEGIGIAAEDLPRIFTPFFRSDRSRSRVSGGVGLGLTLARRIVESHEGTIAVKSTPNAGTIVRVTLPSAS